MYYHGSFFDKFTGEVTILVSGLEFRVSGSLDQSAIIKRGSNPKHKTRNPKQENEEG